MKRRPDRAFATASSCRLSTRRTLGWGLVTAVVYLVTAAASARWGMIPAGVLFDGFAPLPPYQWVHAPPDLAAGNQPAEPGTRTLLLTPSGAPPTSVSTGDGQCTVIFKENAVAPRTGDSSVTIKILPLDPGSLAPPPPEFRFDSNAYRIEATYKPSGVRVTLRSPVTVILRSATGATQMIEYAGSRWASLQSIGYPLSVVVSETPSLGTFALMAPVTGAQGSARSWMPYAIGLAIPVATALALSLLLLRRPRQGRPRRANMEPPEGR